MKVNRKGVFLPLVLLLLLVMCFMGLALNKSALYEYRFTYRSIDHLRARSIAEGAIHSALAEIKMRMNADNEIREAFVSTKEEINFLTLSGEFMTAIEDLGIAMNTAETYTNLKGEEDKSKIDHPSFEVKEIRADLSAPTNVIKGATYGDWIKRLIITASIEFRSAYGGKFGKGKNAAFIKKISQVYDVKIADVRPVGNEFVMMVAEIDKTETEYNRDGDHFFVCNNPELADTESKVEGESSEGISIGTDGDEAWIDLYPPYYYHDKDGWDKQTTEDCPESDLYICDSGDKKCSNSPRSLIPGWVEEEDFMATYLGMFGEIKQYSYEKFVPDNEPWELSTVFEKAGIKGRGREVSKDLSLLTGNKKSPEPIFEVKDEEYVHIASKGTTDDNKDGNLLLRGGGAGIEYPDGYNSDELTQLFQSETSDNQSFDYSRCGRGIKFKQFNHPKIDKEAKIDGESNTLFFNSGWETGRTHLFYKNCRVPCPVWGLVLKTWKVLGYESEGVGDTGQHEGNEQEGKEICSDAEC